jgi:AcrR family transcriptional regulator
MTVRRQARGRARIESILDAAEELVAEAGYDAMTTNLVAARAGISPGSLYQYFGNKAELLDGILDRYAARMDRFWEEQLGGDAVRLPIDEVIDRVVDAVVAFKADRPAVWALFHGSVTSDVLERAARCLNGQLADRLDALYAARAPHLPPERRRLVADVSVATVRSLMPLVMTQPSPGDARSAAAVAELKSVLSGYLGPALAPP